MLKLVLIRHGQSHWNLENKFTGWTDVDLTQTGHNEARRAAELIKEAGLEFDMAYTSVLKRAIRTLWTVLSETDQMWIPVKRHWRLNERHYGRLQGLNKKETAEKHGAEQVFTWRRSYDIPPPQLPTNDARHPKHEPRYKDIENVTSGESLKNTKERVLPYWNEEIVPKLKSGKRLIIAAHGNSLRALIKHIDNVSDEEICKLNIPTGIPLVYELDENTLAPIKHYYLGDPEDVAKATHSVSSQHK